MNPGVYYTRHYVWGPGPKKVSAPFCVDCWPFMPEVCMRCFKNRPVFPGWSSLCQPCDDELNAEFHRELVGEDNA